MARKRDYAAEYARRQARAREQGFGSYYQRRVAGTRPGAERSRARGHRAGSDLLASVRPGDIVAVVSVDRNPDGTYRTVTISLISARTGEEREFVLRGKALTDARVRALAGSIDSAGGVPAFTQSFTRLYFGESDADIDLIEAEMDAIDDAENEAA